MEIEKKVGERIRDARVNMNLTQQDLANKIGKNRMSVNRIELGETSTSIGTLNKIVEVLNIDFKQLFK